MKQYCSECLYVFLVTLLFSGMIFIAIGTEIGINIDQRKQPYLKTKWFSELLLDRKLYEIMRTK